MKTTVKLFLELHFIFTCWSLGLFLSTDLPPTERALCAAEPVTKFSIEKFPPAVKSQETPAPLERPILPPEAIHSDNRPVIEVHTLHDGLHSHDKRHRRLCVPCDAFHDWEAGHRDDFPLRFELHNYASEQALPQKVRDKGVPMFHWLDGETGKKWDLVGWTDSETLLASYKQASKLPVAGESVTPLAMASGAPAAGESPVDLFSKFAGPGKFSFTPDKPVGAYIDDATFIRYSQLKGSVKIVNGNPVVTIDQPYPEISAKKLGLWFRVDLMGATGQLDAKPPTVTIEHSRGKYKLEIKEMK